MQLQHRVDNEGGTGHNHNSTPTKVACGGFF
jgi:hypothetical protein